MVPMSMPSRPCLLAPRPIEDVDAAMLKAMSIEAIREQLNCLRNFETKYQPQDYQQGTLTTTTNSTNNLADTRIRTVEFLYRMADFGQFRRDTVAYAVTNLLDRYLSASETKTKNSALANPEKYQMIALTSFYIAIKLLEGQDIGVDTLVSLADGDYNEAEFVRVEYSILSTLKWRVGHGTTAMSFVQLYLKLLPKDSSDVLRRSMLNHMKYQLELAVSDYALMIQARPSELALAAVYNALDGVDSNLFPTPQKNLFQSTLVSVLCHMDTKCMSYAFEEKVESIQMQIQNMLARVIRYVRDNENKCSRDSCSSSQMHSSSTARTSNAENVRTQKYSNENGSSGSPVTVCDERHG